VEFANVVILNKCDLLVEERKEAQLAQVRQMIQLLNPTCTIVESTYGQVPLNTILGTGLFSMSQAEMHANWLQEARRNEHTPETLEYGISSFTYRAYRPFHPQKMLERLDQGNGFNDSTQEHPSSKVLRAKGFLWLASHHDWQASFSMAGSHYNLEGGTHPWWAAIDKHDWPAKLEQAMKPLWREPYGDRQQEIVIIGQELDQERVTNMLDACLITDEEMKMGPEGWQIMFSSIISSWSNNPEDKEDPSFSISSAITWNNKNK
jgi:G3E family GTPase